MRMESRWTMASTVVAAAMAVSFSACKEDPKPEAPPQKPSAAAAAPAPPPSAPAPAASSAPAAVASASAPVHDCPKDAPGDGTFTKPCDAKGAARQMEVTWTGKMDDKGPSFRVVNKSSTAILYGKIAVYSYDKAGKQLPLKDSAGKPKPYHTCAGAMFGGIMKPGEKAVITFSCVGKENVAEGAAAIEAEMAVVGYADSSEKKVEYYWRNNDLTPDERKKGGVKK